MADKAREWTDAHLEEMERHLRAIYRQARGELTEKWDAYMARGEDRLHDLWAAYVSASADKKAGALKTYQDAVKAFTFQNKWYRDMVDATTYRLAHVNEIAIAYVNGQMPTVYVHNFNQIDPDALGLGVNWTLRDERTVKRLVERSLPHKELNYAKDMSWNARQINSAVLQGILQGESIDKISNRIFPIIHDPNVTDKGIIHKNEVAAIRTARTMVTGAENRGRLDRYEEYESEGVVLTKVWLATPDGRTRDWHLSMDGQEVPVDEPFIDGLGNELEYPGDEMAPGETVYNCRCSMRSSIQGIRDKYGIIHNISDYRSGVNSLHKEQILAEKMARW